MSPSVIARAPLIEYDHYNCSIRSRGKGEHWDMTRASERHLYDPAQMFTEFAFAGRLGELEGLETDLLSLFVFFYG